MEREESALVCFSCGQDSTTCLYWALSKFKSVQAVSFFYGQKHNREVEVARTIAGKAGVPWEALDMSLLGQLAHCSLTDDAIKMDEDKPANSFPNTFVPGRNMIFLSFAAVIAYNRGIKHLVTGVSEADFSGYPDCRDT